MKKVISSIVIGLLLGTQVPALIQLGHTHEGQGGWNYNDPSVKFDATKNTVRHSTITWLTVDNLQATCEAESRKRGNSGFGRKLEACAFWTDNTCTIITKKQTSLHALGHETLHCFQGAFH